MKKVHLLNNLTGGKPPDIFWINRKSEVITGDTHTNLALKEGRGNVLGMTAREYAIQYWDWIRCRKEPNARGGYIVQIWEYTPSVRRRLENTFKVGQIVELESMKTKKSKEVVL